MADERGVPTVCVVEDDPLLRRALKRLLDGIGFVVETFASAEDFLAADGGSRFHCLVLDIHLGTVSGFELHDRLRASGVLIPTVFITGHDTAIARERARRTGAAGFIPKPFDDRHLVATIEAALRPVS